MNSELSVSALRRIDTACDNYEAAWREGRQPRIEDYLLTCEIEERPQLLESLQKLQQELILTQLSSLGRVSASNAGPDLDPEIVEPALPFEIFEETEPPEQPCRPLPVPRRNVDESAVQTQIWDVPRVSLRVIAGPHEGQEFRFEEHHTLLVGRSVHAQLRLKEDVHFSRHHFRLEANPPSCFVMDLGSRNGTFVNGQRITERYLKDGDIVSGGRTKILVSVRDPHQQVQELPPPAEIPVPRIRAERLAGQRAGRSAPAPRERSRQLGEADSAVQIKGYQVYEQIGAGDLGTVYRAIRQATGEECALKVISPAARTDEKAIQTFLREASILNQLQHQHIVRLVEMGASGTELFLSTEFLPTLSWERLSASWPVAQRIRIACGIMSQILSALEHAHTRSMVHRDVKPGNILITRVDGKLFAKLADFGLAKHYTTAGMSQMTREGDVIGSLPFMSPEQFINSREARPACDLYSAGATLYWMISGRQPIALENHPCKFLAILEDPAVPLQDHCPEVPQELARLIHRSLEKSPELRFTSAGEMRQQIRKFAR